MELNWVLKITHGYYDDTPGGYYGRLWEIKTTKQTGSAPVLQDVQHTWDAAGNLAQRQDVAAGAGGCFDYDPLDRLTSPARVAAVYSPGEANGDGVIDSSDMDYVERVIMGRSPVTAGCDANQNGIVNMGDVIRIEKMLSIFYTTYDSTGNITNMQGKAYTYGNNAGPHAVTQVGSTSYTYDANGNLTSGDGRTLVWDAENRPVSVTKAGVTTTFVYDGDGQRVKQTVGSTVTIYINRYYEKTGTEVTTSYYLGGKLIAIRKGTVLSYIMQDNLGSTSGTYDSNSNSTSIKYFPFGLTRSSSGTLPTDQKFTGQRLDQTGLYYYNARYYDPAIGRFISADIYIQDLTNPQTLNRYAYCLNDPLKYTDPSGNINWGIIAAGIILVAAAVIIAVVASPVVWGVALTGFSAIAAGSETMLATADVIMATAAAFGIPAVPAVFGIGIIYNGFRESTNVNSSTTNTSTSNESNLPLGSNSSVTTSSPSPPVIVIQINSPTTIGPQDPVTIGPYNPTTIGPQDQSYDNSNNVYVNYNLYYGYDT